MQSEVEQQLQTLLKRVDKLEQVICAKKQEDECSQLNSLPQGWDEDIAKLLEQPMQAFKQLSCTHPKVLIFSALSILTIGYVVAKKAKGGSDEC